MAQEAMEGEMALEEKAETQSRLLRLFGLPQASHSASHSVQAAVAEQGAKSAARAVGVRKPVCDKVGAPESR